MLLEHELCVQDATAFGEPVAECVLSFDTNTVTVRAIIVERVRDEVKRLNNAPGSSVSIEHVLIKYGVKVDEANAIEDALLAFENNEYFVFVEDEQIVDLEFAVDLEKTGAVSFVKITPMQGG